MKTKFTLVMAYVEMVMSSNRLSIDLEKEIESDARKVERFCESVKTSIDQIEVLTNKPNLEILGDATGEHYDNDIRNFMGGLLCAGEKVFADFEKYLDERRTYYGGMVKNKEIKYEDLKKYMEQAKKAREMIGKYNKHKNGLKECVDFVFGASPMNDSA